MKLQKPKVITFILTLILAVLGLVAFIVPATRDYSFWLMLIAYVLLAVGNLLKGI